MPLKPKHHLTLLRPTKATTSREGVLSAKVLLSRLRHQYSPLPEGHIRTLIIKEPQTDDPEEPLEVELHTQRLDSQDPNEQYEALSYEWGANIPRHPIIVRDLCASVEEQRELCRAGSENAMTKAQE